MKDQISTILSLTKALVKAGIASLQPRNYSKTN